MSGTTIVVGGGLAGLSAAHTILENGGKVILLERNAFMGGNSTKATSGLNGADTRTQAKMGIKDTKEIFEEDTIRGATSVKTGPKPPSHPLGVVLSHNSGDAVHWVQDKFGLALDTVSRLGGHSMPRTHRSKSGGKFPGMEITYALMQKYEELANTTPDQVKLVTKARVNQLLTDSKGRITGCAYTNKQGEKVNVHADAVVLACGGYGAGGLFKESTMSFARPDLMHVPTTNGEHCTGDGINMALKIGASAIDLKHVQVHPTGLVHMDDPEARVKFLAAEALRGEGGILLDRDGNRFCNDIGTRDYVTMSMWNHNKAPYSLVLSNKAHSNIAWHCKHYCGRRVMTEVPDVNGLAKHMNVPVENLKRSISEYNRQAASGQPDKWGKKYFDGVPVEMNKSFMVATVTPVVHYTMGGLEISPEAECVDDKSGNVIPGLFAAGETTGGVHGRNRLGGSALLECVVFGRVAGDSAAKYVKSLKSGGSSLKVTIEREGEEPISVSVGGGAGVAPKKAIRQAQLTIEPSTIPPPQAMPKGPIKYQDEAGAAPVASAPAGGAKKEYTMEEVKKHTTEKDCWVVVNGEVLDVTSFLPDHPGGKMAIMTFAGRDATEEFNMVHDEGVVEKYASECVIGTLKGAPKL